MPHEYDGPMTVESRNGPRYSAGVALQDRKMPPSSIGVITSLLNENSMALHEEVNQLRDRLAPYMVDQKENVGNPPFPPANSKHAGELADVLVRIATIQNVVRVIQASLDI